jgi:Secretion system C-terminal sorting domain
VDLDGKWVLSKIIKVDNTIIINLNTTEAIIGNLYPNPTMSSVTIEMFLIKEEEWNIATYDISGNLTMKQKNVLPVGLIRYTIGDSALKQGLNIVIMESKSTTIKKCIVKN